MHKKNWFNWIQRFSNKLHFTKDLKTKGHWKHQRLPWETVCFENITRQNSWFHIFNSWPLSRAASLSAPDKKGSPSISVRPRWGTVTQDRRLSAENEKSEIQGSRNIKPCSANSNLWPAAEGYSSIFIQMWTVWRAETDGAFLTWIPCAWRAKQTTRLSRNKQRG